MADKRLNVLILSCDQLKAGATGLHGNPDVGTPNMSRLASRGVSYSRHYVTAPMCVPSRTAFWTGMYPHCTGVRHNQVSMPAGGEHYARRLSESGYRMALIGKDHCFQGSDRDLFSSRFEVGHQGWRGFPGEGWPGVGGGGSRRGSGGGSRFAPTMDDAVGGGWGGPAGEGEVRGVAEFLSGEEFNESVTYCATIPYGPGACSTGLVASRAVDFLRESSESGGGPFCAWVSFPDPHHPLAAPEPYASRYSYEDIAMPPTRPGELDDKMERQRVFRHLMGLDRTSEEDLRRAVAMYYGMVSFLDDGIGMVLDALDGLGLRDDTVVVFTADHGDYAGEHGLMLKSGTFYDCMTRVPLVVSGPGVEGCGEVRDDLVSNIDVMPTVMGLLGVESERPVYGRLLPGAGGSRGREAVFAEHGAGGPRVVMSDLGGYPDYAGPLGNVHLRLMHARNAEGRPKMIRTDRWKYVYDPMDPVDELYDMEFDPWELTNLAGRREYAGVRSGLRERLLRWSVLTEDSFATPLYSDRLTLSDTAGGGSDFYYHDLLDQ